MSSDVRDISMSDDQTEFSSLVSDSGNVSSNTTMSSPELTIILRIRSLLWTMQRYLSQAMLILIPCHLRNWFVSILFLWRRFLSEFVAFISQGESLSQPIERPFVFVVVNCTEKFISVPRHARRISTAFHCFMSVCFPNLWPAQTSPLSIACLGIWHFISF